MKKRKDGRYRKIVDGVTFYGSSERELMRKIRMFEDRRDEGPTFADVKEEWWDIEASKLSPSTIRGYHKAAERAAEWIGDMYVKDITTSDVAKAINRFARTKVAKKTVMNHKIVINRIFHYAVTEGYIKINPALEAEVPRLLSQKRRTAASPIDEEKIKNSADLWLMPYFALCTGMRKGELIGLRWDDIDMKKRLISVERSVWYGSGANIKEPKTEAGKRKIPIIDDLYNVLIKLKFKSGEYVFGTKRPLPEKKFRVLLKNYQKETGITATLHQIRKSFTTVAVKSDVPPDVLKTILGHKNISTTMDIYNEVREDRMLKAAEKIKL